MYFPKSANTGRGAGQHGVAASRKTTIDFNNLSPGEWATGSSHAGVIPGVTAIVSPYGPVALVDGGISKPFVSGTALGCTAAPYTLVVLAFDKPYSRGQLGALWGVNHQAAPGLQYAAEKVVD